MMRRMAAIALTLTMTLTACHTRSEPHTTRLDQAHAYISERLDPNHPLRGPMLIYASSLEHMLEKPGDATAIRQTMIANDCLGIHAKGTLVDDTRAGVVGMLTDTPERTAAYRRYVIRSSSMAMSPDEARCMD